MIHSMTGFGQAVRSIQGYRIQIDMKSVNHRYCEVMVRMPREWISLEDPLKKRIQQEVKRGRVDVFVTIDREPEADASLSIHWALADGYFRAAREMEERYGLGGLQKVTDLLRIPDIVRMGDGNGADEEQFASTFMECAGEALGRLVVMRRTEGKHLHDDLMAKLSLIEGLQQSVADASPAALEQYRTRLRLRISDLLADTTAFDESRFAMEVAIMADRTNIDEELTRLRSHIAQCRSTLKLSEPVGRKLDFLVQEMNRETNTIGSKANDTALSEHVVEMKAELEKIREQIQNIE